ncbi:MAG: hypothetical protein AAGA23_04555 [Pseudomonadota bacterium]
MARWIALALAVVACLLALNSEAGRDGAMAIGLLSLGALSMIFRPGWWTFWMPLGFWEQRARDVGNADSMGPAIVLLGWIALLLTVYLAIRL